jgi:hypothetical protein
MDQLFCPQCRLQQPVTHAFCLSCGESLPSHLVAGRSEKVARFFAGIKVGEGDPENGYLRVSCYQRDQRIESSEGSVSLRGSHVRVSMWVDNEARCVMSLPASEAREMATFIFSEVGHNRDPNGSIEHAG